MKPKVYIKFIFFLCLSLFYSFSSNPPESQNKYIVLPYDGSQLLNDFLIKIANDQLENRRHKVANALLNKESTENYIEEITKIYNELFNIRWSKTPLNPEIKGVIECNGYRIEKVVFESHPNHHVSGNLYIPTFRQGPFPAVLEACGHSINGKAAERYQKVAILFALNGYVTLIIDTYGQGEMYQIRDSSNNLYNLGVNFGTPSHTQLDIGSMLAGTDIASYQAWNNIRAIDYLCSRPEVDREKIGVTGNSGGGTQTLFVTGMDPRIKVSAPSCGMQTRKRMFTLNGPADGCHHLAGEGIKQIEYSDYIILSAPKPVLVLAGEKDDLFDINAVSETVREAKWFYKELGFLDHVDLFTVDEGHGFYKGLREGAVWWFNKWLLNENTPVSEPELTIQDDPDLQVTNTGQVLMEYSQGKSITDLNIQLASDFEKQRVEFWKNNSAEVCISKIKDLINYQDINTDIIIKGASMGEFDEGEYHVQKVIITARDGFPLPSLLYIPKKLKKSYPAILYIDDKGKQNVAEKIAGREILMKADKIALTIDLRGTGETKDDPGDLRKSWRVWNEDHRIAQTALHIGKPIPGQRVQDVVDALNYLLSVPGVNPKDLTLTATGSCGMIALHAASIDKRFTKLEIIRSISSWKDIVSEPMAKNHLINVVPGALQYYDLPDLVNYIKSSKVKIIDPVDAFGDLLYR